MQQISEEYNQPAKKIDTDALTLLQSYNWTGNIRELRNVIERLIILSDKTITAKDVETFTFMK
jgi:DNA-binding NtrC family response regulator